MASAAACSVTILLLAVAAVFAPVSSASHPLAAAEATDDAITKEKTTNLPALHNDRDKEETEEAKAGGRSSATEKITSLVSAEEEGKKAGSYWGKAKKLDDDDDNDDSDSDHDHDHDSDSDHDRDHDSDSDHDHDSDSDHDRDHDSDSDDNDDDNDDDDDHNSKNERKKHAAQGRKGAPGGKRDDKLLKVVKKV
ncbi:unnamed protein product [Urochloa humidicola]